MDHLPKVKDPLYSLPEVPYFEDSRFTYSGPPETFTSRANPEKVILRDEDWKRAYSSFVQQWLYFGTLSEFCNIHHLPFQPRDFVKGASDGSEVITNTLLNDYLVAFILENHRATGITLTGENPSMKNVMGPETSGVMWHAGRTLHKTLKGLQQGLRDVAVREDLDPRVWDSLLILGSTLARSTEAMFLGARERGKGNILRPVSFAEFETRTIPPFSRNDHWCPRERRVVCDLVKFGQCEQAFLSQIDRGEPVALHQQCDETKCVAYQVKDHSNVTKHCSEDCGSEYFSDNGGRSCTFIGHIDVDAPGKGSLDTETVIKQRRPNEGEPSSGEKVVDGKESANGDETVEVDKNGSGKQNVDNQKAFNSLGSFKNWVQKTYDITSKNFESVPAIVYREGNMETEDGTLVRKPGIVETRNIPLIKSNVSGWANLPLEGWNLVAISHVWADGLGNTDGNNLPECQLARLQRLVDSFFKESQRPVPFWLDTLMIPKTVENPTDDQKAAKKMALLNMEWIYKNASKIIVLDHTLLNASVEEMRPEEVGARIMCCPWSRRLWTLQEGCLEDRTYFLFKDQAIKWPKLHKGIQDGLSISKWKSNNSQLPKKHSLRKYIKPHGTLPVRGVQQPGVTRIGENQWLNLKQHVDGRAFQALSPVWWSVHDALQDMSVQWSMLSEGRQIPRCMRAMFFRDCSKRSDESLVLTSLMHTMAGSAAELNAMEADLRYKHLFKSLSRVPVDIIFMDQERYDDDKERIRWIPKSLLNVQWPASHPMYRAEKDSLNYMAKNTGYGVKATMSAFLLLPKPRTMPVEPFRFQYEDAHWEAHIHEAGTGKTIQPTSNEAEWVVLPEREFYSAVPRCSAVLLKVIQWGWRRTETRHMALIELRSLGNSEHQQTSLPFVDSEFVDIGGLTSKTHNWYVG